MKTCLKKCSEIKPNQWKLKPHYLCRNGHWKAQLACFAENCNGEPNFRHLAKQQSSSLQVTNHVTAWPLETKHPTSAYHQYISKIAHEQTGFHNSMWFFTGTSVQRFTKVNQPLRHENDSNHKKHIRQLPISSSKFVANRKSESCSVVNFPLV